MVKMNATQDTISVPDYKMKALKREHILTFPICEASNAPCFLKFNTLGWSTIFCPGLRRLENKLSRKNDRLVPASLVIIKQTLEDVASSSRAQALSSHAR